MMGIMDVRGGGMGRERMSELVQARHMPCIPRVNHHTYGKEVDTIAISNCQNVILYMHPLWIRCDEL